MPRWKQRAWRGNLDPRARLLGVSSPERASIPHTASGVDLRVSIGSIHLKNPIIAASGTFGYGIEFAELVDLNRLGGIVVKGLSAQPMAGSPAPRMCETPSGMVNAIGLQNIGVRAFVAEKLPQLRRFDTADYRQCVRAHGRGVRRGDSCPGRHRWGCRVRAEHLLPQRGTRWGRVWYQSGTAVWGSFGG